MGMSLASPRDVQSPVPAVQSTAGPAVEDTGAQSGNAQSTDPHAQPQLPARAAEIPTDEDPGSSDGPAAILELSDSILVAHAWETLFPDSAAPGGEYQILIPSGPMLSNGRGLSNSAFLLRNGTQAGRLDRSAWEALSAEASKRGEAGWAEEVEGPEQREVPLLWRALKWDRASLLRWTEWPAGFAAGIGSSMSTIQASKPQYQRDIDFAWTQKPYGHFPIGLELHRSQFGGGLSRLGLTVADTAGGKQGSGKEPDFWGDAYWWWAVSAGVPGLRYTLALANQPLPRYYWLDPASVAAIREHKQGRLVSQWTGPTLQRQGNLSHTLDARLGIVRYGLHFDTDAYRVPVQTVGLDDLPALFGTWGGGLIIASDILATHFWLDIPDLALKLGVPQAYPSRFRIAFLHFDIAYRDTRNFCLGVSVRVRVENPIMNRPGA